MESWLRRPAANRPSGTVVPPGFDEEQVMGVQPKRVYSHPPFGGTDEAKEQWAEAFVEALLGPETYDVTDVEIPAPEPR